MFKRFAQWFVPSHGNNHEPHLFRALPVALLLVVIVGLFGAAQLLEERLTTVHSSLAAVVASVLVDLTNFDRAAEGLHGLAFNETLQRAAQLKANDMAAHGYFAHNAPDGKTPWYWFDEAGYTFAYAGENLAVFFGDSEDVERAWMNSPAHRANILSAHFTEIGIATAEGYYQGRKTVFVVQMFGAPRRGAPIATLTSESSETVPTPEGTVSGETIQTITEEDIVLEPAAEEPVVVVHQDDTFIAVKGEGTAPASASPEVHSTLWERMLASPHTTLSYVYTVIAGVVAAALVSLVFFEMHVQKPKSIVLGLVVLLVIATLFYLSYTEVVVASVSGISQLLHTTS